MQIETGVRVYPDVVNGMSDEEQDLLNLYGGVLADVHSFYLAQNKHGFYPPGTTLEQLNQAKLTAPDLLAPDTLVETRGDGLEAVRYRDLPEFRDLLKGIADRMEGVINYVKSHRLPQSSFTEVSLRPQLTALRQGDFTQAMKARLNSANNPDNELFVNLTDRVLDSLAGAKCSILGVAMRKDREATDRLNMIVQAGLRQEQRQATYQFLAADCAIAAGVMVDAEWRGESVPPDDGVRRDFGSLGLVFPNVCKAKFATIYKPAIVKYVPEVTMIPNWEERMALASEIGVALHEGVGHPLVDFSAGTNELLQGSYVALKEMLVEAQKQRVTLALPDRVLSPVYKKLVVADSLAFWRISIDRYLEESDPVKRAIMKQYAEAGSIGLNYYDRYHSNDMHVDSQGVIEMGRVDRLADSARGLIAELEGAIRNEQVRIGRGSVGRFIKINLSSPRRYLTPGKSFFATPPRISQKTA